jgi:hypothetical protein
MAKKREESWKNLEDYRKGKAQLKHAVLQHPDEDPKTSVYDYVKKNINRKLWVIPYSQFKRKDGK